MVIEGKIFDIRQIEQHRHNFPSSKILDNILKKFALYYETSGFKIHLSETNELISLDIDFFIKTSDEYHKVSTLLEKLNKKSFKELDHFYRRLISKGLNTIKITSKDLKRWKHLINHVDHILRLKRWENSYRDFSFSFVFKELDNCIKCSISIPKKESRILQSDKTSPFNRKYIIEYKHELDEINLLFKESKKLLGTHTIGKKLINNTFHCLELMIQLIQEEEFQGKTYSLEIDLIPNKENFWLGIITNKLSKETSLKLKTQFPDTSDSGKTDKNNTSEITLKNNKLESHLRTIFRLTTFSGIIINEESNRTSFGFFVSE